MKIDLVVGGHPSHSGDKAGRFSVIVNITEREIYIVTTKNCSIT